MKYPNNNWNDNKRKNERKQVDEVGKRNENRFINDSYNNDNNYKEFVMKKQISYQNNNKTFYSKEEGNSFRHGKNSVNFCFDETESYDVEKRKNSREYMVSQYDTSENTSNNNVRYSNIDSIKKIYKNSNPIQKKNSLYHHDKGLYKNSGEYVTNSVYYKRHRNTHTSNSHERSHPHSQVISSNEHCHVYGSREKSRRGNRTDYVSSRSSRSSRDVQGGYMINPYEQEHLPVECGNETGEEKHSAEFNELKRNLLKYMDTNKNSEERRDESTRQSDRDSRKRIFGKQKEDSSNSFYNKNSNSFGDEFEDASSIDNEHEDENGSNRETTVDYINYKNNRNVSYGTVRGMSGINNTTHQAYPLYNKDRLNDDSIQLSLDNNKGIPQNKKALHYNNSYNTTWPHIQKNMLDAEGSNLKIKDSYMQKGNMSLGHSGDKYNYMNLKSGNPSSDVLLNSEGNEWLDEAVVNEEETDFLRNSTGWNDEDLFGDVDDSNMYSKKNDKQVIDERNSFNEKPLEHKDYDNSNSDIHPVVKHMGMNTSGVGFIQNTKPHTIRSGPNDYNSFNESRLTNELHGSSNLVEYDVIKGKRKGDNIFVDYNENLFPKTQIEESLKVLNTFQVEIEKVCSYVKHFIDPPEPLFLTMKNVFFENEVSMTSKIAIFYVYNHLIQELRHKYRNNMETFIHIAKSGLTNFVIPVIKYICEREKNKEIVSKFFRCITIWCDRNVYSKFICDQLVSLQADHHKVIEMNPQNKVNLAHSSISNEFSKCTPLQFLLQMPSSNNECKHALQNKVVHSLFEKMSKEVCESYENEALETAAKVTDKVVRMLGQELILLNTEQLELSALINDNNEELIKLRNTLKNMNSVD